MHQTCIAGALSLLLSLSCGMHPAGVPAEQAGPSGGQPTTDAEIIIKFDSTVAPGKLQELLQRYSLEVVRQLPGKQLILTRYSGSNPEQVIQQLQQEQGIRYAELNQIRSVR